VGRSNNTEVFNPAVRHFRWSGDEGNVNFWEKEAGDLKDDGTHTGQKVIVDLPFRFLILENMSTIRGGRDEGDHFLRYYSNEVDHRALNKSTFVVRSKNGIEATGSYQEVKQLTGAKFVTSLYIGFMGDDKQMQIGTLEIKGAALTAWIDATKGVNNIFEDGFAITGAVAKKKGKTNYFAPTFERVTVPEAVDKAACDLHEHVLLPYLKAYADKSPITMEDVHPNGATDVQSAIEDSLNDWGPPPVETKAAFVAEAMAASEPAPKKGKAKAAAASADDAPPFVTEVGDDDPWG
jgi:hypothetical protein